MSNYILYVAVRSDLQSMNPGKAEAHSGHAASQHAYLALTSQQSDPEFFKRFQEWSGFGRGFGTQINVEIPFKDNSITDIIQAINVSNSESGNRIWYDRIVDPTYPYIIDSELLSLIGNDVHTADPIPLKDGKVLCHRKEFTAFWAFVPDDSSVRDLIKKYPLKK